MRGLGLHAGGLHELALRARAPPGGCGRRGLPAQLVEVRLRPRHLPAARRRLRAERAAPGGTVPTGGTTPDCSALGRADCDARDDCEFFACAGACAPRGTWADDLCEPAQGCGVFDTIETCDMHRDRCAWYACADRCYPTGTPLERACPEAAPSCETSGTIETCAPRGPTCAWYACADRCYPNGLPLESACPDL
ncbi:MAG: hypothetical protein M5U28_48655 [Sandaracinaceae bacterium]|nr:hypothetical protein [Sandaracinaceae bacterium]